MRPTNEEAVHELRRRLRSKISFLVSYVELKEFLEHEGFISEKLD